MKITKKYFLGPKFPAYRNQKFASNIYRWKKPIPKKNNENYIQKEIKQPENICFTS
jgi:hypothetical protein